MRFLVFFLLIFAQPAFAGKILIVTDEPTAAHAQKVREYILGLPPFKHMPSLKVAIQKVPKHHLNCKTGVNKVSRVMECRNYYLMIHEGMHGADRTIVIKDIPQFAGGGDDGRALGTTKLPPNMIVHELLHTMDFGDEYAYSESEAEIYCRTFFFGLIGPSNTVNIAFFNDKPPYSSDQQARKLHSSSIPWYGKILPSTLITSGSQLGTPEMNKIGLFPGVTCINTKTRMKSWVPGSETTIMGSYESEYIPEVNWDVIANMLDSPIKIPEADGKADKLKSETAK